MDGLPDGARCWALTEPDKSEWNKELNPAKIIDGVAKEPSIGGLFLGGMAAVTETMLDIRCGWAGCIEIDRLDGQRADWHTHDLFIQHCEDNAESAAAAEKRWQDKLGSGPVAGQNLAEPDLSPAVNQFLDSTYGPVRTLSDDNEFAEELKGKRTAYLNAIAQGRWHGFEHYAGLSLPGHGTYRESCGKWVTAGCLAAHPDNVGGLALIRHQYCKQLSCPVCIERSIQYAAMSAVKRMLAGELSLRSDIGHVWKASIFNHTVISLGPAERLRAKDPIEREKIVKDHIRKLRAAGAVGGLLVNHPWRFTKGLARPYPSFHIHVVFAGYVENAHKTEADQKFTDLHYYGRTFDTAAERSGAAKLPEDERTVYRSLSTFSDTARLYELVGYLLSHAGIADKKHTVRYFGAMSYNKFSAKEVLSNYKHADRRQLDALDNGRNSYLATQFVERKPDGELEYICDRVSVQAVNLPDNLLDCDLRTVQFSDVVSLEPGAFKKAVLDGKLLSRAAFDTISSDNAPIAKSTALKDAEPESEPERKDRMALILRFRHRAALVDGSYSAKYRHVVCYVDPDMDSLCPYCLVSWKVILPVNGIVPITFDPDAEDVQEVDSDLWDYFDFRANCYRGMPYMALSDVAGYEVRYDQGLALLPAFVQDLAADHKAALLQTRSKSLCRSVAKELMRSEPLGGARLSDFVAAAERYVGCFGVPDNLGEQDRMDLMNGTYNEYITPSKEGQQVAAQ